MAPHGQSTRPAHATGKSKGPLAGVRVVDLTAMVMGPYCTQILADMGADVIKVEPPGGDNTRYISVGPAPGMAGVFVNVNRGKRSIVLDLTVEADKATLRKLIEPADVFIHSMRSKAIAKLGFAYEQVATINPAIVYTNCYGYGRRGAVYALVASTLQERTTQEWLALFRELDIPAAPIRTPAELFDNPHLNAVGLFETVETPHGPMRFPGVPTWLSRTPGRVAGPAPMLGENTQEVLKELGLPYD